MTLTPLASKMKGGRKAGLYIRKIGSWLTIYILGIIVPLGVSLEGSVAFMFVIAVPLLGSSLWDIYESHYLTSLLLLLFIIAGLPLVDGPPILVLIGLKTAAFIIGAGLTWKQICVSSKEPIM